MEYFTPDNCDTLLHYIHDCDLIRTNKRIEYYNVSVSFDIETSSFEDYQGNKTAIMYVWAMCINGQCIIGRTWGDFLDVCNRISEYSELSEKRRLIIYIHNLGYEFQFIRKLLGWTKVFSLDVRKPVYAVTSIGIEFRCSYLLSGYSLAKLSDELKTHSVKKLVGNLDYKLLRHSKTVLTDDEIAYCLNDVLVVWAYICERIDVDGDITAIPLTKTGYVRKFCREKCLGKGKNKDNNYRRFIKALSLDSDEYSQLKRAFQGGFNHANPFYSGKVLVNVASFDFTSSYPTVMVVDKFPMSKAEEYTPTSSDDFYNTLSLYNVVFDVCFEGLESAVFFDSYISVSRCWGVVNSVINNGRIVRADRLYTTITETDFFIISKMYTWEKMSIAHTRRYMRSYLPTSFVECVMSLYGDKTKLKGVKGKEYEYAKSKEMLNSLYGMTVTDICRDEIVYVNDSWSYEEQDKLKAVRKYNNSRSRFLFYPWGVWVTAYSRRNLFTGIFSCGKDYVYSDTDSIKIVNPETHLEYIEKYNDSILSRLYQAMTFHGLDFNSVIPLTHDGKEKPLGVWDYEGTYKRFKTLGAKRYLTESENGLQLTVSGLNKKDAIEYLTNNNDDVFEAFNDEMYIPKGHTGKMIHTYIDEEREGVIEDYLGEFSEYSEKSCIHLDDADYSLNIAHQYADYLMGIQTLEG